MEKHSKLISGGSDKVTESPCRCVENKMIAIMQQYAAKEKLAEACLNKGSSLSIADRVEVNLNLKDSLTLKILQELKDKLTKFENKYQTDTLRCAKKKTIVEWYPSPNENTTLVYVEHLIEPDETKVREIHTLRAEEFVNYELVSTLRKYLTLDSKTGINADLNKQTNALKELSLKEKSKVVLQSFDFNINHKNSVITADDKFTERVNKVMNEDTTKVIKNLVATRRLWKKNKFTIKYEVSVPLLRANDGSKTLRVALVVVCS